MMSKKLMTSMALGLAMIGAFGGVSHSYYGAFTSEHSVPNWQKIYNFSPKSIKHINHKRNSMKHRRCCQYKMEVLK